MKAFVINLDNRPDRLKIFNDTFKQFDITREPAVCVDKISPKLKKRINEWNFKFENLRKFINLEFDNDTKPIYSLHATSKKLTLFHHTTQNYVIRKYVRKPKRSGKSEIFPSITARMIFRKMIKSWKS